MRVEPFGVGSFVHVMKRGARGMPITRDKNEQWRFVRLLYLLNDEHQDQNWEVNTEKLGLFERPAHWPDRKPLTRIHAWVLMPNHFHLLLEEINEGGIAKFMQRIGGSMSAYYNAKHDEMGSLFQGSYKGRVVHDDVYLRQLIPYIMVKNVFELYPGGYAKAVQEFEHAWKWGITEYPFSSLQDYVGKSDFPIIEKGIVGDLFPTPQDFKRHAKEVIMSRGEKLENLKKVAFEV